MTDAVKKTSPAPKKTSKPSKPKSEWVTIQISKDMYRELIRVNLSTGIPLRGLVNFIAEMALAACEHSIPPAALEVPKGMELPKKPEFTIRNQEAVTISRHLHGRLKKLSTPLSTSVNFLVEASWPSLRKTFLALPHKRWGSNITMMNNAVGAAMKRRGAWEEEQVRKEMAKK